MYDETIAGHYFAYRPPIHELILESCLESSSYFTVGLDVGCGTGHSSEALKKYCNRVIGIDPSEAMLAKTTEFAGIKYRLASAEQIPAVDSSVDIVTLAGSLNYIVRSVLVEELLRICVADAKIVVYDFDTDLTTIGQRLGLNMNQPDSGYDHAANLAGFSQLLPLSVIKDVVPLDLTAAAVAHLLLSEKRRAQCLQNKYQQPDPCSSLQQEIRSWGAVHLIEAKIYISSYRLK